MVKLGESTQYPKEYAPELLQAIPRALAREAISLDPNALPFSGCDYWTAYELSWLNQKGKPLVYMAQFSVPADSPNIVESKSFKYYLNSLNEQRFASRFELETILKRDLTQCVGAPVDVQLCAIDGDSDEGAPLNAFSPLTSLPGELLDTLDIEIKDYNPKPSLLKVDPARFVDDHACYSHLLKSNCPMTGQPDWATLWLEYSGALIKPESILAYLVSFRQHQGYHENCVEQIFADIASRCKPEKLTVYARYTRRGGLDINPFRSTCFQGKGFQNKSDRALHDVRLLRQ